jgi:hypothetical protein
MTEPEKPEEQERSVVCQDCGTPLKDRPGEPRHPCPVCRSTNRTTKLSIQDSVLKMGGADDIRLSVWRAWDSNSLTLGGVTYSVLVTVAAVAIQPSSWWGRLLFSIVVLGLLAMGLLVLRDPVIRAMRWLLERGKG